MDKVERSGADAPSGQPEKPEPSYTVSTQGATVPNADDPAFAKPLPSEWALDASAQRHGFKDWFDVPAFVRTPENRRVIVDARLMELHAISAWPERRPKRTAEQRAATAKRFSDHLPDPAKTVRVGDDDLAAMKAAFIRRFDDQLPRIEALMAVAHVGYRMALRDFASAGEATAATSGGDAQPSGIGERG